MSTVHEDTGEAAVALVSGILIGFAATLLFVKIRSNRAIRAAEADEDYFYEGGDLFI